MFDIICGNILLVKSEELDNIFSKFVKIDYKTKIYLLYFLVQFCWYYKKSEKGRFFLLWNSFLVLKWTNYQIIQGIRGDNTILDNLQPFCLLSEHSHILAMSISYVEGGTLWFCLIAKIGLTCRYGHPRQPMCSNFRCHWPLMNHLSSFLLSIISC